MLAHSGSDLVRVRGRGRIDIFNFIRSQRLRREDDGGVSGGEAAERLVRGLGLGLGVGLG